MTSNERSTMALRHLSAILILVDEEPGRFSSSVKGYVGQIPKSELADLVCLLSYTLWNVLDQSGPDAIEGLLQRARHRVLQAEETGGDP